MAIRRGDRIERSPAPTASGWTFIHRVCARRAQQIKNKNDKRKAALAALNRGQ